LYYVGSRYYDPEVGRFISCDNINFVGANGDLSSFNLYSYCGNNPISRKDSNGYAWETVFDAISLGSSIIEVIANPANPWSWIGLVGDVIDVAVPFVGGIGESIDALKVVMETVENADDVIDAAKSAKKMVSQSTGSYENIYKSGSTYVGKGSFSRAIKSAQRNAERYSDEVASITWKKAPNTRAAFIDEYESMCRHGGPNNKTIKNESSYNIIWSPGRKYYMNDNKSYYRYGGKIW